MPHFIEVSHPVVEGMKTYPGLPGPRVEIVFDYEMSHERYQGKAEFRIASLHLCGNTGTYVDAPIHRYRGGPDLASLPLERLANMEAVVIDCTDDLSRPAHTMLLGAGIPICEHMTNLAAVPATGGRLHAVPIAWVGGASFPVRAYVMAP